MGYSIHADAHLRASSRKTRIETLDLVGAKFKLPQSQNVIHENKN